MPETIRLDDGASAVGPFPEAGGAERFELRSPFQAGVVSVRLRRPLREPAAGGRRVLLVLPVMGGDRDEPYGEGLAAVGAAQAVRCPECLLVAPRFAALPWYADHPSDLRLGQESHLLRAVVPLIDRLYPHAPRARGLLGFSKSGWGAWSLLLRHPGAFGAAVAWDAPLAQDAPTQWGMAGVFGDAANFGRYRIGALLAARAAELREGPPRLGLHGRGQFAEHHERTRERLRMLRVPHEEIDGPRREHRWDSGWVDGAVASLMRLLDGVAR